jgi:LysR family hydrogen peroxide-inducible transcriptional activator
MTLQQLQYVVALDAHRHFVKAAESCFVAQPTLTLQVKKLEDELGIILFDRTAQPLKPTVMGIEFISRAREILRNVASLKELVSQEKELLAGTLRVGIIPTLAPYLLPLIIKGFQQGFPQIQLVVKELQSEEILTGLKQDSLDLGLLVTPVEDSSIREFVLFYEPFLVFASEESILSKKNEIEAKDIVPEGLWLLNQGHCFRNQVLNICNKQGNQSGNKHFSFESGSIETLKNLVKNNFGYTLIPELAVQPIVDKPYIKRFKEPVPAREVSIVTHQSFTRKLLLQQFQQHLLHVIPAKFKKNKQVMKVNWR